MAKAHPGFKAVQSKIASEEGISKDRAGAILAASSRGASKSAKKKNPNLKKVKGGNSVAGPMKAKGLTEGPKHNLAAKEHFTSGAQKNANLMEKCPGM